MAEGSQESSLCTPPAKALIFDLMGTCLDWYSTVSPVLTEALSLTGGAAPPFNALHWRQAFFDEIHARFKAGLSQEDIDETHRRTLLTLLRSKGCTMSTEKLETCVKSWHSQKAWPDVTAALPILRSKFDVVVLANGTVRLQIDITKSSGLDFDMLLSSELLDLTKPDPAIYHKAIDMLGHKPEECIMVAAHGYDLKAAKELYVHAAAMRNRQHRHYHGANETSEVCVQCISNGGLKTSQVVLMVAGKSSTWPYVRRMMHSLMAGQLQASPEDFLSWQGCWAQLLEQ